ncbi:hypothetical protein [Paenibacillus glycanilyticus]|uniref:Uncharacterized protein n=1 Tax=Paenibacillus glycanilyticus TaxID=126569 RepID=A0ABQ6GJJ1_9BACL|nr:hypothetical protein [Paenibacillus glycanilyticus]GLX70255.1 hypothetical protein MU1_46010 [Paenibacillus glycanilyticus]
MSYDLMVFEPSSAPRERHAFMDWFEQQAQWPENHDYDDPLVCSEALQCLYRELLEHFPNMNAAVEVTDVIEEPETEDRLTDYSLGSAVIYAAFSYSVAEEAYGIMRNLAIEHKVGFFDVSGEDGEIIFPEAQNKTTMQFQGQVDNHLVEEEAVDFAFVEKFLKQMNHSTSSFCTVSLNDFCYIQCAGSSKEMTIEWREGSESGFRHFVIGRHALIKIKRRIKYSGGNIIIKSNEVLHFEDARLLFKVFFEQTDIRSLTYSLRETTEMFE